MDQNTHLDRLTELTIIHRAQLKELVQQLPAIREELRAQIEKRIEQTEPEIRRELESFVTAKTDEEMLRVIAHFDKQIRDAIDATDRLANEKIMSLMAEKKAIAELIKKAQIDADTNFEELTAEVKKLIEAGGKELAEETNRQKLFLLQENKTINPRGKWDETETYEKLDLVTYNGSSFVANETIPPGTKPTFKSPYWTLIARRGGGGGMTVSTLNEIVGASEDGQLLIGDNGNFTKAFLTAGTGVTITNSAGGIEISAPENGTVVGPASATDNAITRFDGTTGDLIQNSGITLDDANSVANVAQIEFDTSATPTAPQGAIYWNGEDHRQTLIVQSNGVPINVGQDVVYRVKASAPITKGQVVMFTGSVGNSGGITAAPATGLAFNQGNLIIGVAAESMNTNDWGIVSEFGYIRQINTTGGGENWGAGTVLYFNPSVAGGLTKVKPTAPEVKLEIAAVIVVSATVGEILVRVGISTVLGETESNVEVASSANNDFLVYDTGAARWENKSAADSRTALGLGTIATQDADSVDITGGSIDATPIGAVTASTGAFTSLTSSSTTTLNGTTIPASSTLVTTIRQISSGTGLSGGGDLSADRTISLADTTVTAAAYGSATQVATFTVDAQGRLTAAASVTATPAFSSIQSTPTTLSGYGITDAVNTSALGAANGVATLDSSSKLTASQIPDIAVTDYLGASADQAAMLALSGQKGDWTTRTDLGTVWVITGNDPTQLADWTQLSYPTAPVTSVAGKTGAVTLVSSDVGLGNVTNDAQLKIASNLSDVNDAATARSNLGAGTVNSVDLGAGTGISLSGGPITASGVITVTNTAPDQTVVLSDGTGITTSGSYPNFTITNSAPDQTVSLTAGTSITISGTYPAFTITNTDPDQTVVLNDGTGITTSGTYPNFTITNSAPDETVVLTAGTSITISGTYPAFTITNTDPDQTVVLSDGTGISTSGTYPNFTITNTAPDQTVALTAGTSITISGSYPAFTITNTDPDQTVVLSDGTGISTSGTYPNFTITNSAPDQAVTLTAGTSITISGSYPAFTITNTDPDQTVVLSDGTGITTSGTYPNFTITNSAPDQTVAIAAGTGISVTGTYPSFTISSSGGSGDVVGPASSTDNGIVRFDGTTGKLVQDSSSVVIDDSGNVGIGTTSPAEKLDVNGNVAVTGALSATGVLTITKATGGQTVVNTSGNTTGTYQSFGTSAGTKGYIGLGDQLVSGGSVNDVGIDGFAGNIIFATASATRATVTSTGLNSTAIGATTPSTGAFTTLSATGGVTMANATALQFKESGGTARNTLGMTAGNLIQVGDIPNAGNSLELLSFGAINTKINTSTITSVSSTGLAVTGEVSVNNTAITTSSTVSSFLTPNLVNANRSALFVGRSFASNDAAYIGYTPESTSSLSQLNLGFFGANNLVNITAAGNVGIGTTSPTEKLTIVDSTASSGYIASFTRNSKRLDVYTGTSVDLQIGTPGAHSLGFFTNNNDPSLTITSAGNVGIGTASPAAKLDVAGTINSTGLAVTGDISTSGSGNREISINTTSNASSYLKYNVWGMDRAYIRAEAANPGAGSGTGSGKLIFQLANNPTMTTVGTWDNTSLAVTGDITATGNITAYYSDDRLKTKLGNIENALDKVSKLNGFYYEANETAQALGYKPVREVGLSAQQVEAVLPEVVAPAPIDNEYKTLHYERVIPLLVEAIKELKAEIELLKK